MQLIFFTVDRKFSQTKTFSQKMFFMFCLEYFFLKCVIKDVELKVNNALRTIILLKKKHKFLRQAAPVSVRITYNSFSSKKIEKLSDFSKLSLV